jgi:hypothetical protein
MGCEQHAYACKAVLFNIRLQFQWHKRVAYSLTSPHLEHARAKYVSNDDFEPEIPR